MASQVANAVLNIVAVNSGGQCVAQLPVLLLPSPAAVVYLPTQLTVGEECSIVPEVNGEVPAWTRAEPPVHIC